MQHQPPFNFSAGPALLPKEVMDQAQAEFQDWQGTGLSVMDFSHRGKDFVSIAEKSEADLRQLLEIPEHYKVLFTTGGATFQFATIPMNLLQSQAVYVNTGIWSSKSVKEARKYGTVHEINALDKQDELTAVVPHAQWEIPDSYDYLHYTPNETISGVEYDELPESAKGKLVADMSSNILSRPINIEDHALIYAGAQKNIGPAGITLVIVREDILQRELASYVPSMMQYKVLADNQSMYNTPPTYAWYLSGLVFDWLLKQGGVAEMERRAHQRSEHLYQFIDQHAFYHNPVHPSFRSRMNIPFILANESLNDTFLKEAEQAGLVYLKGHRSVGGMRASLYNAMPIEGVYALTSFMERFAKDYA
ncbi:3-phosphoserine/phosphohydroxythreonine transaminase [Pleionea sp. CnH1-48]|uniref:3-phosphoserine/phosphohydroxythreonine transaminase n=1 Tax=Pleionea sp. CnH1-48 TaxID=2954494 RepID=UPI002098666B|nr:3-phosphoserine/phosphohydroxythreonine transaminase [Pleionea sp. CnH1-48]MCO7223848.1 3-phosphoserine/phosphohydroxythreonine transaminase [Pleionea sp. CnH1-48]